MRRRDMTGGRSTPTAGEAMLLALVAATLVTGAMMTADQGGTPGVIGMRRVVVRTGESLWSIARRNPMPGLSTAETVSLIKRANGLRGSSVASGEALAVPLPGEGRSMASARHTISE